MEKDSKSYNVAVFVRKEYCPYCEDLKKLLKELNIPFETFNVEPIRSLFVLRHKTVPQLYVNGRYVGDYNDVWQIRKIYNNQAKQIILEGHFG